MAKKKKKKKAAKLASAKPAAKAVKKVAKKSAAKKSAARKPAPKPVPRGPAHQVVHWEIQSKAPERLHSFYGEVFEWKIDANNPMNYGMVASGGRDGIDGGIGGSMGPTSQVLVYVNVPNINAALDRINASGGRTIMPRTDVGPVIMGIFQDPEGNTLGLVESYT
jgi:predicted enzyme related to lactoylglutathione lyase